MLEKSHLLQIFSHMIPFTSPITALHILFWRDLLDVALPCKAGIITAIFQEGVFILCTLTSSPVLWYLPQHPLSGGRGKGDVARSQGCCPPNCNNLEYSREKPSHAACCQHSGHPRGATFVKTRADQSILNLRTSNDLLKMYTKCLIYKLFINQ